MVGESTGLVGWYLVFGLVGFVLVCLVWFSV
jgi:hypothetical protein